MTRGSQQTMTVVAGVKGNAAKGLRDVAAEATRLAKAEEAAGGKLAKVSGRVAKAKRDQVSASKQVSFAIREQAAAGKPLQQQLVRLEREYEQLTVKMRAAARAGKPIDIALARQAVAARKASVAIRAQTSAQASAVPVSKQLASSFMAMAGPAAAFYASIRGGQAVFRALITDQIALGTQLVDTSSKLGVSVESLQELRFAAESVGVSQRTADMALQRFTRRAAEAAKGTGEAKAALAELGVELKDRVTGKLRSTEDLLGDVADGLKFAGTDADRLRLAFKLFDSEGAAFVNALSDGSAGLDKMTARARELGGVMSGEQARGAKEAGQAITDLGVAVQGLVNVASEELIPAFTSVVTVLTDVVAWGNRTGIAVAALKDGITGVVPGLGIAVRLYRKLAGAEEDVAVTQKEVNAQVWAAVPPMVASNTALRESLDLADKFVAKQKKRAAAIKAAADEARKAETGSLLDGLPDDGGFAKKRRAELLAAAEAEKASVIATVDANTAKRIAGIDAVNERELFAARNKDAVLAFRDAKDAEIAARRAEETEAATASAMQLASAVGSAFAVAVTTSESAEDAMKSLGKAAIKIGAQMLSQFIVNEALKASSTAASAGTQIAANTAVAVSGAASSQAGIPIVGPALAALAAAAIGGVIAALLPSFNEGGRVLGTGRDPVIAQVAPGERIVSANRESERAGSGGANVNVYISALDAESLGKETTMRFVRNAIVPALSDLDQQGMFLRNTGSGSRVI